MKSVNGKLRRWLAALVAVIMIAASIGVYAETAEVEPAEAQAPAVTEKAETARTTEKADAPEKQGADEKQPEADKPAEDKAEAQASDKAGDAPEAVADVEAPEAKDGEPAEEAASDAEDGADPEASEETSYDAEEAEAEEEAVEDPAEEPEDAEAADDEAAEAEIEIDALAERAAGDEEVEDLGGTTSAVDNSTTLADGSYTPEGFTAKLTSSGSAPSAAFTCSKVRVSGGKAYATINIGSTTYKYVKASGGKYNTSETGSGVTVEIPVKLNADNVILGRTTSMGGKEISITINVTLAEPKQEEEKEEDTETLDNSTDKAEGEYTQGDELYKSSRGLTITCDKITVKDGKAYATITFSSSAYPYVKVAGVQYDTATTDSTSTAVIPVKLNEANVIYGMSSAMNKEIEYTITPTLSDDVKPDGDEEEPEEPEEPEESEEPVAEPLEDGEYTSDGVESSSSMFNVVACTLTANGGKYTAVITLSGTGYDKLFMGKAADANDAAAIGYAPDAEGRYTFTIPVAVLDAPIDVAAHSVKNDNWLDRTLTFKSSALTKVEEEPQTAEVKDGDYSVEVESSAAMFKITACTLTAKDGAYTAVITLSGTGYTKVFMGKADDANDADAISYVPDAEGRYTFTIPVTALDTPIDVAALGSKWYDRQLTFKSETLKSLESASTGEDDKKDDAATEEENKWEDDLSGSTSAVNNSTKLADGTYTPDSFSFSGGSGKVTISCSKITVRGGKTYATITFSSPNYPYVKAGGRKIYGSHGGGSSTFEIPVVLNQNNHIIGMTTAMSNDHEVDYTIYVGLKAALAASAASDDEAAEEAEITGLQFLSKDALSDAALFSIYRYEDGFVAIDVVGAGRTLLVPEGAEAPVGLNDEVTLVQLPVENAWIASDGAAKLIADAEDEALAGKLAEIESDPLDPNYAALMMSGIDLAVLPNAFADTGDRTEDQAAAAGEILERLDTLGIPAFVDRSADEETEEARAEWIKAYAELLK